MVFQLKYATAEERLVAQREQKEQILEKTLRMSENCEVDNPFGQ